MTDTLADKLEALVKAATPGQWKLIHYDAGDCSYYDANGPCPGIFFSEQEDCGIVHWDGFKQQYWSAANGNQRQIEANATLIVELVNNLPAILRALRERDQAVEALEPFAFREMEKDYGLADTQYIWETIYSDRVQDWFSYEEIEAARATLASIEGTRRE